MKTKKTRRREREDHLRAQVGVFVVTDRKGLARVSGPPGIRTGTRPRPSANGHPWRPKTPQEQERLQPARGAIQPLHQRRERGTLEKAGLPKRRIEEGRAQVQTAPASASSLKRCSTS